MVRRNTRVFMKCTPEEVERIEQKMEEVGIRNRSAYLRKMALDGYCVNLDFSDIRELVNLLRRCSIYQNLHVHPRPHQRQRE